MTTPAARQPHAGPTYLLGRAVTPGAAETRRFLTRNRVPFQWIDLDNDPLERAPLFLESSQPGLFVAGDIRHGSIKRVASAVAEGAMDTALVHRYLADDPSGR